MKMNDLTSTEEMIMMVIWSLNSGYLKDIMEAHPAPKPHQNTVSTYLKILQEKEFIYAKREGRIFKYKVAISYEDYQTQLINHFLETHFHNSSVELVQKMIADKTLDAEDLQHFFNVKTVIVPIEEEIEEEESAVAEFIKTLTEPKKKKKKMKKKKKQKKKKKNS